jgi:hypothetical protein
MAYISSDTPCAARWLGAFAPRQMHPCSYAAYQVRLTLTLRVKTHAVRAEYEAVLRSAMLEVERLSLLVALSMCCVAPVVEYIGTIYLWLELLWEGRSACSFYGGIQLAAAIRAQSEVGRRQALRRRWPLQELSMKLSGQLDWAVCSGASKDAYEVRAKRCAPERAARERARTATKSKRPPERVASACL